MTLVGPSMPPRHRSYLETRSLSRTSSAARFTPATTIISSSSSTFSSPKTSRTTRTLSRGAQQTVYSKLRLLNPGIWRWGILLLTLLLSLYSLRQLHLSWANPFSILSSDLQDDDELRSILRPNDAQKATKRRHDPVQWLRENSSPEGQLPSLFTSRPRAAIISLVRNEELEGILQSMRQLELHWNRKYHYPWIFFNEKPFSEEFKAATSNATSAMTHYHLVPRSHWATPAWISTTKYMDSLDYLGTIGVGKGYMLSYHSMIRWQSGFFYNHPALASYDWYWRVEPDVHFFCDISYDPFRFLAENDLVYGFNMAILDDARSFASLWSVTRDFISQNPHLIHPDADLEWLLDPDSGMEYNNCQFFSNFEIGSLNFFRDVPNEAYFEHLDHSGGFYYERYGDAPVHTLALAMFARKDQVWFFRDIGYQHDIARHCPPGSPSPSSSPPPPPPPPPPTKDRAGNSEISPWYVPGGRCACEPTSLDENFYKLVPMESPQLKPRDTCIRLWLGGKWLEKKDRWRQDVERAFGGDGYGGYRYDGM